MAEFITLAADEAKRLRGVTSPGNALNPIALADGLTFILPLEVLSDPAHAKALAEFKLGKLKELDPKLASTVDDAETAKSDTFLALDILAPDKRRDVKPDELAKPIEDASALDAQPENAKGVSPAP